jgi:peroxiredoxin
MTPLARVLAVALVAFLIVGVAFLALRSRPEEESASADPEPGLAASEPGSTASHQGITGTLMASALREIGADPPPGAKLVLYVVFSTSDCGGCLSEAAVWEKLHQQFNREGFQAVGIGHAERKENLDAFVRDEELTFTVHWDRDETVKGRLALDNTPYKIIVDETGSVVLTDPPNNSPRRQRDFEELAKGVATLIL